MDYGIIPLLTNNSAYGRRQQFWYNDPTHTAEILFNGPIYPNDDDSIEEILNSLTRLLLVITLILFIFDYPYWYLFFIVGLATILCIYQYYIEHGIEDIPIISTQSCSKVQESVTKRTDECSKPPSFFSLLTSNNENDRSKVENDNNNDNDNENENNIDSDSDNDDSENDNSDTELRGRTLHRKTTTNSSRFIKHTSNSIVSNHSSKRSDSSESIKSNNRDSYQNNVNGVRRIINHDKPSSFEPGVPFNPVRRHIPVFSDTRDNLQIPVLVENYNCKSKIRNRELIIKNPINQDLHISSALPPSLSTPSTVASNGLYRPNDFIHSGRNNEPHTQSLDWKRLSTYKDTSPTVTPSPTVTVHNTEPVEIDTVTIAIAEPKPSLSKVEQSKTKFPIRYTKS